IAIATAIGAGLAHLWGWSIGAGIIFGLCLSVASTVVLLRALEDRNALDRPNGRIAVGWLIVEDLAMVLVLVLLPAFAQLSGASGAASAGTPMEELVTTLALTLAKVMAFIALAVALGPRVVPWMLRQVARTGSRELFTLSVLAIALGIAFGSAELFGVSFALGAFFAGVVLSESDFSHRAAANSLPLQDAFAILFFVSVGMLFDPQIIVREPLAVGAVLLVILFGKSLAALGIDLLLGYPVATALTVSASVTQIGEFSFVLSGLALSAGRLPFEGVELVLAGALLSITLNPASFAAVDAVLARFRAGSPLARYGHQRLAGLQSELTALRKRLAARETERSLRIQNLVDRFPIFAQLDHEAREELLLLFRAESASPGERVIRKGDRPGAAYFISEGSVVVSVNGAEIKLGPGEFFGEMALLSGARRSADVTAVDFCKFLTLQRRDFLTFVNHHPQLRAQLDELAAQRARMNRDGVNETEAPAA